ncbi:MAG: CBS domain-containing protein [Candidatus Altiarchaeales archaeon]|nr:CBS domain-containing protein [Candidatus Altiarchaeales archaeon]MBD3416934.1 CBS domain-containing protein [Candidatus Altiarchaeales archaeon]
MKDIEGLKVGDAMTRGVICVDAKDTVMEAAEVMRKNDISSVIVTKKGDGIGILTERDIITKIVAENRNPEEVPVGDVMTSPLITIRPDADLDDAARAMRDRDIRRLVVSDKDRIIGVLSEFDIVRLEPAMHLLIREQYAWTLSNAHAASEGVVSGICESCENFSDNLRNYDGRLLCDDCLE